MKAGLYLSSFMGLLLLGCGEDVAVLPGLNCAPGHEQVGDVCVVKEIYFEGGWFTMGRGYCDPPEEHAADFESGLCALPDRPHEVFVAPFFLDATEIASGAIFLPSGCRTMAVDCDEPGLLKVYLTDAGPNPRLEEAREFLEYCESQGKTLPTEAQWEFAASAGGTRTYPWGEEEPSCDKLLVPGQGCKSPDIRSRVASYPPSPEGVYDLAGNAPEVVFPGEGIYTEAYPAIPVPGFCPLQHCEQVSNCLCEYKGVRGGVDIDLNPAFLRAAHRATFKEIPLFGGRCVRNP